MPGWVRHPHTALCGAHARHTCPPDASACRTSAAVSGPLYAATWYTYAASSALDELHQPPAQRRGVAAGTIPDGEAVSGEGNSGSGDAPAKAPVVVVDEVDDGDGASHAEATHWQAYFDEARDVRLEQRGGVFRSAARRCLRSHLRPYTAPLACLLQPVPLASAPAPCSLG